MSLENILTNFNTMKIRNYFNENLLSSNNKIKLIVSLPNVIVIYGKLIFTSQEVNNKNRLFSSVAALKYMTQMMCFHGMIFSEN